MFPNIKPSFGTPATNTSFGFTSNVTPNPFGQSAFGKPAQTGFGAQPAGFGSTVPLFGQTAQHGTSLFATAQPTASFGQTVAAQPAFGNSMFGNTATQSSGAGLFGASNTTQAFGQQSKAPSFGFGQNTQATGFFGATNNPAQPQLQNTNLFGTQNPQNLFGNASAFGGATGNTQMGTVLKFTPVTGTDTMVKGNTSQTISTRHHCITCMKDYEGKSLEELRWEDYQVNRKGPQQGQPQTAGLFGNMSTSVVGGGLFGQNPTASTSNTLFGQQENKSVFGNAPAAGFGQQNTAFGAAPAPNATSGGLFGKPLTTTFGANASTTATFPFNSSASTTNLFGQSTVGKPFGQTTQQQSLFGQTQTPGFGAQSTFGTFSTPSNTNVGLFNQNKTTPFNVNTSINSGGFGAFGQNMTQNTGSLFPGAKTSTGFGNFGTPTNTAPIFGQSSFGQTNQPLFNTSFNKSAPLFGQPNTTNQLSGGMTMGTGQNLFGQNANKPNTMFGNTMGVFNTGFGNTPSNTSFNLSGTNQQTGQVNVDPNQLTIEQQILAMTYTPYGIQNLLNNVPEVESDNKDTNRPTNPSELSTLLNSVIKSPVNSPAERLQPVQVYGRKIPMFDGLEHRDEMLISNIRMNQNPKRLVIRGSNNISGSESNKENTYAPNSPVTPQYITPSPTSPWSIDSENVTINLEAHTENDSRMKPKTPAKTILHKPKTDQDVEITDHPAFSSTMITTTPKKVSFSNIDGLDRNDKSTETRGRHIKTPKQDGKSPNLADITHNQNKSPPEPAKSTTSITPHLTGIVLNRPEYYTVPSLDELVKYISEDGTCIVKGFTIGREGYGNVYYPDAFDVSNLNLDEIVYFRHKEINVYPDDSKKVPQGTGLNRRAQVTLDKVWPFDRKAKVLITDLKSLSQMEYATKLRRLCEKQGTRFVEYRPDTGSWVFKVDHFSKYGLADSDESDDEANVAETITLATVPQREDQAPVTDVSIRESANQVGKLNISDSYAQRITPQSGQYFHTLDSFGAYNRMTMNEESAKCTLMKSTFFNEPQQDHMIEVDRTNQLNRGKRLSRETQTPQRQLHEEIIYMEQEPIDDQNLPMDVFGENNERRTSVTNGTTVDVDTISRDEIIDLDSQAEASASGLNNRNNSNLCALKSKSFRVGWAPDNTWFGLLPNDLDHRLYNMTFMPPENEFTFTLKRCLESHMRCQLRLSTVTVKNGIPTFTSKLGCDLMYAHQEVVQKNPKYDYHRQIWNLCHALWGDINSNDLLKFDVRTIRRQLFHKWIKEAVEIQAQDDTDWLTKLSIENVLGYISGNHIPEASRTAFRNKYPALSTYLAQMPSTPVLRTIMTQQLDEWADEEGQDLIPDNVMKLYILVAGLAVYEFPERTVVVHENWDWLRTLALYFWYILEPARPLSNAVEVYEEKFMTTEYTTKPVPEFNRQCTSTYDLRFKLMKYYADSGQPLMTLLDPATHTSNPLDYRLSWLLMQVMMSLGHINISAAQKIDMHTNFATQLEQMGHWHWAIFVLLFIEEAGLKIKLVNDIIERHVKLLDDATRDYMAKEKMLTDDFKIPTEWIDSAKAILAKHNRQYKEAILYFYNARNWNEAHNIIMYNFVSENFMCYDYEFLQKLLKRLSKHSVLISNWESAGGLLLDFTKLSDNFKDIMVLTKQQEIREKLSGFRAKIMSMSSRFKGFPKTSFMHDVCLAVMSTKISTMLRELLKLTDATIQQYTDAAATINNLPLTGDSLKQEIRAILMDFSSQMNNKTSAFYKDQRLLLPQ